MLFTSYYFLLFFLPVTLIGFYVVGGRSHKLGNAWLVVASFFFYGWWNPIYLILLFGSALLNYVSGRLLLASSKNRKVILISGITFNLLLLGYFKYANFFVDNINSVLGTAFVLTKIILPLGISFFTFTQIAYLVDAFREETEDYGIINYFLFVSYFPHLLAGPIIHHKEMMPQFNNPNISRISYRNLSLGLTIFFLGAFKKVIVADGLAIYANLTFNNVDLGFAIRFIEAWMGALAYSLQLYFDFSGYSDMAIGLALMTNIKLPINFNSPYKALNVSDFWRRWHITLSRFLRDYLYIPLGGNRKGQLRRYLNTMITMVLGGFWHGAGWTFILWGTLHGIYQLIHQVWVKYFKIDFRLKSFSFIFTMIGRLLTFSAVVIGWVFFRATSVHSALLMLKGMFGLNGISLPQSLYSNSLTKYGVVFNGLFELAPQGSAIRSLMVIGAALLAVWILPNLMEIMAKGEPALETPNVPNKKIVFSWQMNIIWAIVGGLIGGFVLLSLSQPSEFLYFQF